MTQKTILVDLGDDVVVVVEAERIGPEFVSDEEILDKFDAVGNSIERVCGNVLSAVKKAKPHTATIELGFGLAIEAGKLVALFGKGKGEASIKVTLEWSAKESGTDE